MEIYIYTILTYHGERVMCMCMRRQVNFFLSKPERKYSPVKGPVED